MTSMKNYIILLLGIFLLSAYPIYDLSLDAARSRAKAQNIPYFVNVYADWCVVCKHMEETALSDSRVQSKINNFYEYTALDLESEDGQLFAVQQNIQTLPALFIFDPQDQVLYRSERAHSVEDLITVLDRFKTSKKSNYSYTPEAEKPSSRRVVITSKPERKKSTTRKKASKRKKRKSKKKKEKIYSPW